MEILIYVLILLVGLIVGFLFNQWAPRRFRKYTGTMFVYKEDEETTTYSLELNDNPESMQFKKEITFKIDASQKSPNRD